MADKKKDETTVLGDIDPVRRSANAAGEPFRDNGNVTANDEEFDPIAARKDTDPDWAKRSGSRDVTGEPNVSGTRNMRNSSGGATGSILPNRPE